MHAEIDRYERDIDRFIPKKLDFWGKIRKIVVVQNTPTNGPVFSIDLMTSSRLKFMGMPVQAKPEVHLIDTWRVKRRGSADTRKKNGMESRAVGFL